MLNRIDRIARPDLALLMLVPLAVLGVTWPVLRLLLALAIVLTGLALLTGNPVALRKLTVAQTAIAILAVLLAVSLAFPQAGRASEARYDLVTLLAGLAVLAICTLVRVSAVHICAAIAIAGAVAAVSALIQGDYVLGRLWGLGLNCNYFGALLTLPFVAAVGLAWTQKRPAWLVAAVPCAVAIAATESRAATIAAVCGAALVFVSARRWWWQIAAIVLAAAVGYGISAVAFRAAEPSAAPAAAVNGARAGHPGTGADPLAVDASGSGATGHGHELGAEGGAASVGGGAVNTGGDGKPRADGIGDRTDQEIAWNNEVRLRAATLAVDTAMQHPLRGIGYAGFASYAEKSPAFAIHMNTHNDYLRLAAEAGLPALLVFGLLLWLALRDERQHPVLRAIVVCYAVGLLFANTLSNLTITIAFWAALGLLLNQRRHDAYSS